MKTKLACYKVWGQLATERKYDPYNYIAQKLSIPACMQYHNTYTYAYN